MSEYQYIEFRAVDRSLNDKELAYAQTQSTRAEITKRSFTNEYNYASFGGNVNELLRRGYDVFLECTNYGTRTLKLRLPHGLPFESSMKKKFLDKHLLRWDADGKGKAGILTMNPFLEIPDSVWDFDDYMEQAIVLRNLLISGDLRALYCCWLLVAADQNDGWDEAVEPPVPLGLEELENEFWGLFIFFDLDPLIVCAAAAERSSIDAQGIESLPDVPKLPALEDQITSWTKSLTATDARKFLKRMLLEEESSVRDEILAGLQVRDPLRWPTIELNRSFPDLVEAADQMREEQHAIMEKKAAAKAKRENAKAQKLREQRMIQMVSDPQPWIESANELVESRGAKNYERAAEILAELQEALAGSKRETQLAKKHAAHLVRKYPTLTRLKGSLRKHGVLD